MTKREHLPPPERSTPVEMARWRAELHRENERQHRANAEEAMRRHSEAGMWLDSPLLRFTTADLVTSKLSLKRHVVEPTYIGGASYYGRALDLQRDRAAFLRALIGGIRP